VVSRAHSRSLMMSWRLSDSLSNRVTRPAGQPHNSGLVRI
jgi:hypothetical protein